MNFNDNQINILFNLFIAAYRASPNSFMQFVFKTDAQRHAQLIATLTAQITAWNTQINNLAAFEITNSTDYSVQKAALNQNITDANDLISQIQAL